MSTTVAKGGPQAQRGAIGYFLIAAAALAIWLGFTIVFPVIETGGVRAAVTRIVVYAAVVTAIWYGVARTDSAASVRIRVWLAIALPYTAWLMVVWWLAVDDAFRPHPDSLPVLPIAVLLPVLLIPPIMLSWRRTVAVLDAMPASWLIGYQVVRIFGGSFLLLWIKGDVSASFALVSGVADLVVGLSALPVAYLLHAGVPSARGIGIAFNVFGLLDLAYGIAIGALTQTGIISSGGANIVLGTYPTVMIPVFGVPSAIILHILSLWQLKRAARKHDDVFARGSYDREPTHL